MIGQSTNPIIAKVDPVPYYSILMYANSILFASVGKSRYSQLKKTVLRYEEESV